MSNVVEQVIQRCLEVKMRGSLSMWMGRGDASPKEFDKLVTENSRIPFTVDYVLNKSGQLAEQLETGLWAMGYESFAEPEWIEEYQRQRWSHGDPDHIDAAPPKPQPREPVVSLDEFGTDENPLKHLTIGDVMDLLSLDIAAEEARHRIEMEMIIKRVKRGLSRFPSNLEPDYAEWMKNMDESPQMKARDDVLKELTLPERVELISLFEFGDPKRTDENWLDLLDINVSLYNADQSGGTDLATMCALSSQFPQQVVAGLRRLGLIPDPTISQRVTKSSET